MAGFSQLHFDVLQLRASFKEAWDGSSKQRLDFRIACDLQVTEQQPVELPLPSGCTKAFRLRFSDGHEGHFVAPKSKGVMWQQELCERPRSYWAEELHRELEPGGLLHFEAAKLEQEAMRWIEAMHSHGLALVSGALGTGLKAHFGGFRKNWGFQACSGLPTEAMAVKTFAEKLGTYLAPTVYGETFQIKSVTDPNNLAYSNLGRLCVKR